MLKKRILIALLAALFLTGCGNAGSVETTADTTAVVETVETEPEETLDIDVQDYGGYTVNIALAGNWSFTDFVAEELTGEPINDAVYIYCRQVVSRTRLLL